MSRLALLFMLVSVVGPLPASADDEGFMPLFNGQDLSGWVNVNLAPNTFTVKDGLLVSTGKPTGTIRTERMYENFVMEIEWRHMVPKGNAGIFIWSDPLTSVGTPFNRAIEVQVLDGHETENYTSHGDVFAIHGATMKPVRPHPAGWARCLPSEKRAKTSPEWNHYRITANDGVLKLAVNGKEVSGGYECNPRLPQSEDQGAPLDQSDAGGNGPRSARLRAALHGPGPERLEAHRRSRRPLAAEELDSGLRRQERSERDEGQAPLDREGIRRLPDGRRLAAGGQTGEEEVPRCARQRRRQTRRQRQSGDDRGR
jgi:hypothetical protein